jgi:hypothetical protein
MTWKLYAVVSAGAFVATYLMSTPKPDGRDREAVGRGAEIISPAGGGDGD